VRRYGWKYEDVTSGDSPLSSRFFFFPLILSPSAFHFFANGHTSFIWPIFQNRCVNMIANLFHAPVGQDEAVISCGIVASSESAGLAFKMKWQHRRKAQGLPIDKPNIVTGVNVQV